MSAISADQATDLARQFKAAAIALGKYQLDHWDELPEADKTKLSDFEYTLLDYSQNLITYAVGTLLDDAQASLADIEQATAEANRSLNQIDNVKNAIRIAAALVSLGAAIYTGDVERIVDAVKGVTGAVVN